MKVYFISGLAADRRAFKHVELPMGFETEYLDWIPPDAGETLQQYALRLAKDIDSEKPFVTIGLSMGGMIATEIAKKYENAHTILISSVPSPVYFPPHFRMVRNLRLYRLVPVAVIKSAAITKRLFSRESKEDKIMLQKMIRECSNDFVKWAISAIMKWDNKELPSSYIHIHGTRDEMFPVSFTKPTHIIKKGGHFMIMTHARQVNEILEAELKKLNDR